MVERPLCMRPWSTRIDPGVSKDFLAIQCSENSVLHSQAFPAFSRCSCSRTAGGEHTRWRQQAGLQTHEVEGNHKRFQTMVVITLEQRTINLLNWTLSMAKAAIHHSAVDYRLHHITTSPITLFKASVKSHINYQYKISKLRQQLYYFNLDWCIHDTYASVTNNTLVFNL